jgi:hypothetical protein
MEELLKYEQMGVCLFFLTSSFVQLVLFENTIRFKRQPQIVLLHDTAQLYAASMTLPARNRACAEPPKGRALTNAMRNNRTPMNGTRGRHWRNLVHAASNAM